MNHHHLCSSSSAFCIVLKSVVIELWRRIQEPNQYKRICIIRVSQLLFENYAKVNLNWLNRFRMGVLSTPYTHDPPVSCVIYTVKRCNHTPGKVNDSGRGTVRSCLKERRMLYRRRTSSSSSCILYNTYNLWQFAPTHALDRGWSSSPRVFHLLLPYSGVYSPPASFHLR